MGRKSHFVGRVEGGRAVDLFSSATADVEQPEGAIVEVQGERVERLAEADSAEARLYGIAAKSKLDPVFPEAVEEQVAGLVQSPGRDDPALEDFRSWPFVTIDGASSMDLDQAAFVEQEGGGHVVHYALADAAYYVQPGTPLHDEAIARGASYYLPGVMVPMLPRALSEGLVSLNPNVDRRSVVFSMSISGSGGLQ